MEHLAAPFCYLRNEAAFRHVCVFADKARQLTHREKQVYVPLLAFFFSTKHDPRTQKKKPGHLSHFSTMGWQRAVLSEWCHHSGSYLFSVSISKLSNFWSDWQVHDVSRTSYMYVCLDSICHGGVIYLKATILMPTVCSNAAQTSGFPSNQSHNTKFRWADRVPVKWNHFSAQFFPFQ